VAAERRYVDLHLHTHHSDGSDSPVRMVERAVELGFAAMAITDHDTVEGVSEAAAVSMASGMGFLPGTEISAGMDRTEVHILGLGIDPACAPLHDLLARLREGRATRAERIVAKLNDHDVPISLKAIEARTADGNVGRMHIAQELLAMGLVRNAQAAFDKYIGIGKPGFVSKDNATCPEAIDAIHAAGGLAFIAHPGFRNVNRILPKLLHLPFDGVEAYHSKHSPGRITELLELAEANGLLVTGGSDDHGQAKHEKTDMGSVKVPYRYYAAIRERVG
jgi:hypothetical protein